MNNRHSLALALATLLLLSLSGYNTIVPSFSDISQSETNNTTNLTNIEVAKSNDNDGLPSTGTSDNDLGSPGAVSNAAVLDTSPPGFDNSQIEPAAGDAAQSSTSEAPSTDTLAVDSPGTSSDDTPATSDSSMPSFNEPVLNGTGPSSSQGGATGGTSGSGNFGGDPSSANGASTASANDTLIDDTLIDDTLIDNPNIQNPGDNPAPDGSSPSNGTSVTIGSGSGESSSNQSAVEVPSSGNNISSTEPATGGSISNASSTGSSTSPLINPSQDTSLATPETIVQAASSSDPNTIIRPISISPSSGDGQVINHGDVSNTQNVSIVVSFDRSSYSIGDTVQVTVQDGDGNVNPSAVNTIQAVIKSPSDQTGITVILLETGPNTGQFVGTFELTDSASTSNSIRVDPSRGESIQLFIDGSHPRARASLNGVSQPGTVQVSQVLIPRGDFSEVLVGNAIDLTLSDGAQLAPNEATDFCLNQFAEPVSTCGGHITLTMSYANAPLNNQLPSQLTIFQKVGGTWINLKDFGTITVDETTKTVTAINIPFGPGIFTIGANIGGGGGGGGGIGFPGAGIVLDFLAPVTTTTSPPPSPPTSPPPATEPGSTTTEEKDTPPQTTDTAINTTGASSTTQQSTTGSDALSSGGQASGTKDGSSAAKTGNITIVVPGEGNVTLVYKGLLSEGSLSVEPVTDKSEITALKIVKATPDEPGTLLTSNNTKFSSVGTIFKIVPADARFNDTITVTIPYDAALVGPGDLEVRMLQYTGSEWQDVTTTPPANGSTVTGNIDALGPVVAAVRSS